VILNAIRGQLAKTHQPAAAAAPRQQQQQQAGAAQQQQQQQQQRLPSIPQVVTSVSVAAAAKAAAAAAATAAGTGYAEAGPVTEQDLQQLWQQLMQLLFPAVCGGSSNLAGSTPAAAAAPRLYPFQCQAVLILNDVMEGVITWGDDVTDGSEDDGSSWDESEGWQEVSHSNDAAGGADDDEAAAAAAAAAAAGELLAAAVDPLYQQSAQRCLAAARSALAHYLTVSQQCQAVSLFGYLWLPGGA
jgi:cell wall-associated NlpC family hydrolase